MKEVRVIDLFAGPGGLGEGFSTYSDIDHRYRIGLSIEKDPHAHKTLELRSFFRQFRRGDVPEEYYDYVRGKDVSRAELFEKYPKQAEAAEIEAWCAELGKDDPSEVDSRILNALDGAKDWVLIGGPPCQAYSLAGRSRYAAVRRDSLATFEADHRHRLYEEYLRILARFRPPVFIMENVKGLLSSKMKGQLIFEKIRDDLSNPHKAKIRNSSPTEDDKSFRGYDIYSLSVPQTEAWALKPSDFIIRSEEFGVPQKRHRVILMGIRADLDTPPAKFLEKGISTSVKQVIGDLPKLRSRLSRGIDSPANWKSEILTIAPELENSSFPEDLSSKLKRLLKQIGRGCRDGSRFISSNAIPAAHSDWYIDPRLGGALNHEARGHMTSDLHRYLYASTYAQEFGVSPRLREFPDSLLPNHANARAAARSTSGMFEDRFRVQVSSQPASTVVSHIAKDGHYYIHYDPKQCRSLTVREAARLQTFPDNYFFEGNRTQQFTQVGNAVPPLLALQIAHCVSETLKRVTASTRGPTVTNSRETRQPSRPSLREHGSRTPR